MDRSTVSLKGDSLTFNAMHFLTFLLPQTDGRNTIIVEPLHGHDFHVHIRLSGPLNDDRVVVDFIALREKVFHLLAGFHLKTLLPEKNPHLLISISGKNRIITTRPKCGPRKEWTLPRIDTMMLPVANVTAEELAQIIAQQLFDILNDSRLLTAPVEEYQLTVELEEAPGSFACGSVPRNRPKCR